MYCGRTGSCSSGPLFVNPDFFFFLVFVGRTSCCLLVVRSTSYPIGSFRLPRFPYCQVVAEGLSVHLLSCGQSLVFDRGGLPESLLYCLVCFPPLLGRLELRGCWRFYPVSSELLVCFDPTLLRFLLFPLTASILAFL